MEAQQAIEGEGFEAVEAIKEEEQITKLIGAQCIKASNQIGKD